MNLLKESSVEAAPLAALRAELEAKIAEVADLETAPLPDAEVKTEVRAALDAEIVRLRDAANARVLRMPGGTRGLCLAPLPGRQGAAPELTWLALLQLPGFADVLVREALTANPRPAGLASGARAKRLSALRNEIADLERREELTVLALEAQGFTVLRRADADPALLVELWSLDDAGKTVPDVVEA